MSQEINSDDIVLGIIIQDKRYLVIRGGKVVWSTSTEEIARIELKEMLK